MYGMVSSSIADGGANAAVPLRQQSDKESRSKAPSEVDSITRDDSDDPTFRQMWTPSCGLCLKSSRIAQWQTLRGPFSSSAFAARMCHEQHKYYSYVYVISVQECVYG